jgi:hypothetical protein
MKKILILTMLLSMISIPSFAEETPVDQSAWDAESGWAVVDSNGQVSNIIVCTNAVCGNDEFLNTAIQNGAIAPGSKIVRQLPTGGGAWGTYDSNTETFIVDRGCYNCEPYSDMHKPGTIKGGIVTNPVIIPGLDTYMLNNPELTIDEAAELLEDLLKNNYEQWLEINAMKSSSIVGLKHRYIPVKKTKYRKIQLTNNLDQFKKVSKTKSICKISKNSVLILKSGTCKIDIYKDGKKERVVAKVSK